MKESSGTLLYRRPASDPSGRELEVLLVHPSGNYNRKSPWSVPKGIPDPGESLEKAASRETWEETGVTPRELHPLGSVVYTKSKKRVHCFVGEAPADAQPKCCSWEVDRAEFVPLSLARTLIHPDQAEFLTRLEAWLRKASLEPAEVPAAAV